MLECHYDHFINELNAVIDLYVADRLEFNPSEDEFAVENFESDNDEDDPYKLMRPYDGCGLILFCLSLCGLTQIRPYIKWMFRP